MVRKKFRYMVCLVVAEAVICGIALAQTSAADPSTGFRPLDDWKSAVIAGDAATLKSLYSIEPAAKIQANDKASNSEADINFWLALKARSMKLDIIRLKEKPGAESIIFRAEVQSGLPNSQTVIVTDAQGWRKQGEQWRIVGAERIDAPHLTQPSDMKKNLYPAEANAHAEIKEAEERAAAGHKRMLLVFGANWCYDCHVLDLAFHRADFAEVMAEYEVVHVDIGDDGNKNADVAREFQTPLDKGIPALAVVESDGKLVVSQKNGEFEDARALTPETLLEFLNKWKPEAR